MTCVQYCGGAQYHGGYHDACGGYPEYHGGYHDKFGGYLEYHGGYHDVCGGIMSTMGGVQHCGEQSFVILVPPWY